MKKYLVLTSVLALTACGGGSGSGGSGADVNTVVVPGDLAGRVTATDNDVITKMKSEVIVASNSDNPLSRKATVEKDGVTFASYRLEDIQLYAADFAHTDNGFLQIGMDENTGRIENITMTVGGTGAPVARDGNTNRFFGPIFEYVENGKDQAVYRTANTGQTAEDLAQLKADLIAQGKIQDGGHWNMINEYMDVVTYGRDIGNGESLQYADFGHFNPVYKQKYKNVDGLSNDQMASARQGKDLGRGSELDKRKTAEDFNDEMAAEDYQLFAGGYAISGVKLEKSLQPNNNTTYRGMAIGRLYTTVSADDGVNNDVREAKATAAGYSADRDINKAFTTKSATMTIGADGTQTLYMPFNTQSDNPDSKFYDITLVQHKDGTLDTEFTGNPTDPKHNKGHALEYIVENESGVNFGYYGVNTPSEAAGTARLYSEEDLGGGVQREYEIQGAYGMKLQH